MTSGAGAVVPGCGQITHIVKMHLLYLGAWRRKTQKESFDDLYIDCYCTTCNRLYCSFALQLLIFIYTMMGHTCLSPSDKNYRKGPRVFLTKNLILKNPNNKRYYINYC